MKIDLEKLRYLGFPDVLVDHIVQSIEIHITTIDLEDDLFEYSDFYINDKDVVDIDKRMNGEVAPESLSEKIIAPIQVQYEDGEKSFGLLTRINGPTGLDGLKGVWDSRVSYLYVGRDGKLHRWTATFEDLFLPLSGSDYAIHYEIMKKVCLEKTGNLEVQPLFAEYKDYLDVSMGNYIGDYELSPAIYHVILREIMNSEDMRLIYGLRRRFVLKSFYYFKRMPRDAWREANRGLDPYGNKTGNKGFEVWNKKLKLGIPDWHVNIKEY
jgi:hypothetical protein